MWLCHTFVSLKVNIFLLFAHISSYFISIMISISALLFYIITKQTSPASWDMAQVRWGHHKMRMTSFGKCSYISLVKWIVFTLTN